MATVALIVVGVLALLMAVLFAALVEMYRDVRQIREAVGILDRPLDVEIGRVAGTRPGNYGLPRALDSATSALVLFLSDRCATCHALAAGFSKPLPSALWVVVDARNPETAADFLTRYGLSEAESSGRLLVDSGGEIAGRIGLQTTPVGFRIQDGVIASATSIPSSRYLTSILPEPIRLREAV